MILWAPGERAGRAGPREASGVRPVRTARAGRPDGAGLAPGGGGFRKTMRTGRGGEGGGNRVRNLSRGRRKESPLGGRGWGEAQKKY